ncbi:bifunctional methylenetetrahydrofolate dehydrogenase/methenyltetrahydrofolate cyclohydrolase [Lactobacillus gallinarum]|jgi:methylenetetrahydrofolate dehydrogenase (NADP+)/methenyltetrahydrofolate cyclohydrolase|uniref:bifunctional methylenetetrahydrofolate dehydrogenase/methenyltetrahydrofolate cyclohydrolase n=1 Tax=Lactobacillus gallinarum TaxID=52242 RepID=UPI001747F0CB|nr:bifunctional methylenetetrahydrofolate dehydrogenase/methenyltetrahydrofolate cyclohydrolase [Lactobacillus gallinarum]MDM8276177.1 bifunctional methylenetetrahydrofolate dehydrogenase/methenyltetrahydrofolate cyclohydrolase [Lactobacillus gallinarum]MDM8281798.1 bifunctional methylenetetrahydrofolate dehydrogenase/methenyltetrahydrofolate cyclohydrolase [Lactobacillus gallinarum]NMB31273.1 bifunctional methylenetetrahydrofolate dehydrogenase/methenyltetrahydrofolate cyclohydrolase [Lactobaci
MGKILDGKAFANLLGQNLKEKVKKLKDEGITPHFCVINIGDDPASKIYVRTKKRRAEKMGIIQDIYQMSADTKQEEALALIDKLNADPAINGLMVQLPAPKQIDADALLERIDPNKDVDGLTPANIGHLWMGNHFVEPATAEGIIALLKHYEIPLEGKNVVIIGRSNIVGKPLAALMLEQNATVTIAHSRTKNLGEITKKADVLVSATGQAFLVKADMVKDGAVVVDVGMNHVDGKLVGDVDFDKVKEKTSYITPVPGGVGPLTVQFLMEAVVKLTRRQNK